jgi:hypothetical protein
MLDASNDAGAGIRKSTVEVEQEVHGTKVNSKRIPLSPTWARLACAGARDNEIEGRIGENVSAANPRIK